jgi:transcription antitermination factor NusG
VSRTDASLTDDARSQVFVPILEGETSVRESSVMPSYIFVRMRMSQDLHFLISSLQYVVSFVGSDRGGRSMSGQMQV